MSQISPSTVLQRIPELRVDVDSGNGIRIHFDATTTTFGRHGLAVLDAFSKPMQMSDGLEELRSRVVSAQDWIDLTGTIQQMHELGVLRDVTQGGVELSADSAAFDAAPIHIAMLNDRARTSAFIKAIRETVKPGDVVIDIGTGTGVLAVAAARAGAKHVYAIEATGIGRVASAIAEANKLSDRITLVPGWSTETALPERADVLVSEIIGNEPLGERVLEAIADARKRLLNSPARLIPRKLRVFGLPAAVTPRELKNRIITADTLNRWRSWYGVDFGPLAEAASDSPHLMYVRPHLARKWRFLSEPIPLATVDFGAFDQLMIDNTQIATATETGDLNGLLVYFELDVGPNVRLSTHPFEAGRACSWRNSLWVFGKPLRLHAGEGFLVTYRYRVPSAHSRVSVARLNV